MLHLKGINKLNFKNIFIPFYVILRLQTAQLHYKRWVACNRHIRGICAKTFLATVITRSSSRNCESKKTLKYGTSPDPDVPNTHRYLALSGLSLFFFSHNHTCL